MDPASQERLQSLFLQELEELRAALNHGLVALEAESDPAVRQSLIDDLFRHAHTLKGAARSAGVQAVASVCHTLEERLDQLRQDPAAADASTVAALFELVDAIPAAGQEPGDPSAPPSPARPQMETTEASVEQPPPVEQSPVEQRPSASGEGSASRPTDVSAGGAVRLPAAKLEALLTQASGLLMAEQALAQALEEGSLTADQLRDTRRSLRQAGAGLRDSVRSLRMAPFRYACEGLDRLARDVAAAAGKQVHVEVRGGAVELDRPILDALREPLGHLVRNAVDHGIEPAAQREAAGKPERGRIQVQAGLHGGRVQVELHDDGAGVDVAAVRSTAAPRGIDMPEGDSLAALFVPGFSTARVVTHTSGRGVGLDAVRESVEALGGTVELDSRIGEGLTVRLLLPLTLSSLRVVVVEVAGHRVALASAAIDRLLRADTQAIATVEGRERLLTDDGPVPLVSLAAVLGLSETPQETAERFPVVLATTGGQQVALEVGGLGAELEVTVTGLGERVAGVPAALGGALLPDGDPVVVVSPTACARFGVEGAQSASPRRPPSASEALHVLLADDSLTTRTLERTILERAGYLVTAAADGREAFELAGAQRYDVVVSDVAMPRMDGITLCERLRASSRHGDVPIILVTSRARDEDRLRGLEAGANAYLTKQAFDQGDLIATIEQLAGTP